MRRPILIAVALVVAAELGIRLIAPSLPAPLAWPTFEEQTKVAQMSKAAAEHGGADTVLFGSSVVDTGLDPALFPSDGSKRLPAYNAALRGTSLWSLDVWAERKVLPLLRPRTVVIGVSGRELNANDPSLEQDETRTRTSRAFKQLLHTESTMNVLERWTERQSRLFGYRTVLREPLNLLRDPPPDEPNVTIDALGHVHNANFKRGYEVQLKQFLDTLKSTRRGSGQAKCNASDATQESCGWQPDKAKEATLERMLRRARATGAQVVVLFPPENTDWSARFGHGLSQEIDRAAAIISAIAARAGARFIDAGPWDKQWFADEIHLNEQGARRLTQMLVTQLRQS